MPRDALVCVRPLATYPDPPGSFEGPAWPAQVAEARREDNGWWTLRLVNGVLLHACDVARNAAGDRALVAVCGPRATIDAIAAAGELAWPIETLWTSVAAEAAAARRRWPWWRISGTHVATGRVLANERVLLPTPFPADPKGFALPATYGGYQITAIHRPGFGRTVAGYTDDDDAEATR